MELPFAVEAEHAATNSALHQSDSSLVTASSQGSFMNSSNGALDSAALPPNTPQDVLLPRYDLVPPQRQDLLSHNQVVQSRPEGHLVTPAQAAAGSTDPGQDFEPEVIDFTYVNISEAEADEVDTPGVPFSNQRGDVLAILLGGMHQSPNHNQVLLVSLYL